MWVLSPALSNHVLYPCRPLGMFTFLSTLFALPLDPPSSLFFFSVHLILHLPFFLSYLFVYVSSVSFILLTRRSSLLHPLPFIIACSIFAFFSLSHLYNSLFLTSNGLFFPYFPFPLPALLILSLSPSLLSRSIPLPFRGLLSLFSLPLPLSLPSPLHV